MCKAKAVGFTLACGHYTMYSEEPCASALARDPTGSTPCNELINELELQRVSGSWSFVINFEGQKITVHQTSSGHCDAWREEGYSRPNYLKEVLQSSSAAVVVAADADSATGEASNSDGSAIDNDEPKTSQGKGRGFWKKIKGTSGKGQLARVLPGIAPHTA